LFVAFVRDPGLRARFDADPRAALVGFGLDDAELEAFVAGDERLHGLFAAAQREAGIEAAPAAAPVADVAPEPRADAGPRFDASPAAFTVRLDPTLVTRSDGSVGVRLAVSVHGEPAVPPSSPMREVPASLSGHRVGTPEVAAAAAAVWAATDTGPAVRDLVAEMTRADLPFPVGPAYPPRTGPGAVRVHVVGLGITAGVHLTPEVAGVLATCRRAYYLDSGLGVPEQIAGLGPEPVGLFAETYVVGGDRAVGYRQIAARVVEDALTEERPLALAIHGHPTVFSYPARLVADLCDALGIGVRVWAGVSAIDTVLAELRIDPSVLGLAMFEATDLMARDRSLPVDVPVLVWQVGMLGSNLYAAAPSRAERLAGLQASIERSHGPDHPVTAVFTSPHPAVPTVRYDFPARELAAHAPALHAGFTLFVPPAAVRPVAPERLATLLDAAWLARVTQS
jgi:hypothetical protein